MSCFAQNLDFFTENHDGSGSCRQRLPKISAYTVQVLCEWFAEHPIFYDQSEKQFRNIGRKRRMMSEKGK